MLSDEELFAASLNNPSLFAEVVKRYQRPFFNKVLRLTGGDEDEAADIVQDALVKIYIQAARFKPRGADSFRAWAYTVLVRTALSYLRRLRRDKLATIHLDNDVLEAVVDPKAFSFDRYATNDFVWSILSRLPLQARRIITLHFFDGLTTRDIAQAEGLSENAVRTRLSRARKEFKKVSLTLEP